MIKIIFSDAIRLKIFCIDCLPLIKGGKLWVGSDSPSVLLSEGPVRFSLMVRKMARGSTRSDTDFFVNGMYVTFIL